MRQYEDSGSLMKYNKDELQNYIKDIYGLKDNYLIGNVVTMTKSRKDIKYLVYVIEELINPITGHLLPHYLTDAITTTIKTVGTKEELEKYINQTVIFQFDIQLETLSPYKLVAGEAMTVKKGSVESVDDFSDILRIMKIDIEDLEISGIFQKKLNEKFSIISLSHLYKNLMRDKFNKEKEEQVTREKELLSLDEKLIRIQSKLDEDKELLQKTKLEVKVKTEKLKSLGFSFPDFDSEDIIEDTKKDKEALPFPNTEKELLKQLQNQMFSREKRWVYEEKTLGRFYAALKTNELIILSGPSGTGKSSLVSVFADVIGAQKRIIPVQPSWMDKQDLLGYYNPSNKQYVSSPLLDVIIEAKENKEKYNDKADLFLVCLDELNLAQVEYYLADILSVRELENEGIQLYSIYEYDQAMEEIKWYVQKSLNLEFEKWEKQESFDSSKDIEYQRGYRNLQRFKPYLYIPDNIRFIGTINVDGTTKALSPKVIDRSFIIPLDKQNKEDQEVQKIIGYVPLGADLLKVKYSVKSQVLLQDIEETIRKLAKMFEELNIDYTNRVSEHISKYIRACFSLENNSETLLDEVLLMKVLPRINYLLDNAEDPIGERFKSNILDVLKKDSASYKKVKLMVKKSKDTNVLSFWS